MHKCILILCLASLISTQSSIYSQTGLPFKPYAPNTWENIKPEWYSPIFCVGSKSAKCDGYNTLYPNYYVEPFFDGNNFYYQLQIFDYVPTGVGWFEFFVGQYIEKRDWQTGELLSNIHFQAELDSITNRSEAIVHWAVDKNYLELTTLKKISSKGIIDNVDLIRGGYAPSIMRKRKYDHNTSELVYFSDPDLNDSTITRINMVAAPNYYTKYELNNKNEFEVTPLVFSSNFSNWSYHKYFIDSTGSRTTKIDSFKPPTFSPGYHIHKVSDSLYFIVNPDEKGIVIYHLDQNFEIIKAYRSEEISKMKGQKVHYFSDKYLVFRRNIGDQISPRYEILRFDTKANLINQIAYKLDGNYLSSIVCLECDLEKDIYILSAKSSLDSFNVPVIPFIVLKSGDSGELEIVKSESQSTPLRYIQPYKSVKLPNGNCAVFFEEQAFKSGIEQDGNAKAHSVAVFRPDELGLPKEVNTIETKVIHTTLQVSPNPITDFAQIVSDKPLTGVIKILDIYGRVIQLLTISNELKWDVDFSHLNQGIYFIQLTEKGRNLSSICFLKL